jgi:alpha-mannosidase
MRSSRITPFLAAALLAAPACAHLKMPKEPSSALVKRSPGAAAGVLYYCGYSHVDCNWLWDWADTIKTWDSTAQTELNLMYRFPDFHFGETQAAAYLALERVKPQMFKDVQAKVASGQWDILGGMWDESDENIPSGEGLARGFLYGQDYFKEKFNKQALVGFLPDTFGHTRQLPQILNQAEIQNFYFQRCPQAWHLFWWKAPDGSKVLAYSSPGWYGDHVNQSAQTNYPSTILSESGVNIAMVSLGTGDHGGGPTITDLTTLEMLKTDSTFPEVREANIIDFFNACRAAEPTAGFPQVDNDLQFTFQGCYTSQSLIKKVIRDSENSLYTTETLATLANILGLDYPAEDLRYGWRHSAYNQFHDIAPGSGIRSTYEEAWNKQKLLKQINERIINNSWATIEKHVDTSGAGQAVVLFNPLAWTRSDPVEATVPFAADTPYIRVTDASGTAVPAQITSRETRDGKVFISFVFVPQNLPSMGYRTYYVNAAATDLTFSDPLTLSGGVITTPQFIVNYDSTTGQISRVYDKTAAKDVLATGQNAFRFVLLPESGENAWSISLASGASPIYLDSPTSFKVLESGPVRAHLQAVYTNGATTYTQDLFVYRNYPRIDSRIVVDYHDSHLLMKELFPTSLNGATTNPTTTATFDVPFYAITRPLVSATDSIAEYPEGKWFDESDSSASYGVSILNDCKSGADCNGGTMRQSLFRDARSPDSVGDQGIRTVNVAMYPHTGTWKTAGTMRRGYEFNVPVLTFLSDQHSGDLGPEKSFVSTTLSNVAVTAFKRAEDGNGYVLRYYDYNGTTSAGLFTLPKPTLTVTPVNILEHTITDNMNGHSGGLFVQTKPYGIQSARVTF